MTKKIVLSTIGLVAIVAAVSTVNMVHASTIGNFGAGYDQGKSDAYNRYSESCPYDFSSNFAYCSGYHAGYAEESAALNAAQP